VVLVALEVRRSRRLWAGYAADVQLEQQTMESDLRYRLDPLTTRYGLTPAHFHREIATVGSLVEVDRRKQALAVSFLLAGILTGFVANAISTLSS
jgi:hypothetical protein